MLKNKVLFFFALIFFSFIFFSCKRKHTPIIIVPDAMKNHWQRTRLFGKIKIMETNTFYYSKENLMYTLYNINIQHYSYDGFLTNVVFLDKNRDTVSLRKIYYLTNANENYWEEKNFRDGSLTLDTFIYDRNGFKSEELVWAYDSLMYKILYKTDAIGSIIEMKRLLPDYSLANKIYYNDLGLTSRIEEYDPHNRMYKFVTIEYDNYGDEVNRRAYKNASEIIEYTYTQYDDKGSLQKIIFEERLHNLREDRIYSNHDAAGNWLQEIVMQGNDTLRKRERGIVYY